MYFYCEEYEGSYLIFMTEKFYNYTKPYFQQHSFYNIFPSLFNLSKEDFYKYVETTFGAKIISGKYFKIKGIFFSIKGKLGVRDIPFTVSQNICDDFRYFVEKRCSSLSEKFDKTVASLSEEEQEELKFFMGNDKAIPIKYFIYTPTEDLLESPRDTSSRLLNSVVKDSPFILGGSADLFAANRTYIKDAGDFSANNYLGKNIFFGVREHAMGAILNGLALSGFRVYGSTFLSFSDYMKPAIRMAAMMKLPVIYIFLMI